MKHLFEHSVIGCARSTFVMSAMWAILLVQGL